MTSSKQKLLPENFYIENMTRQEADLLGEWAAQEGWNPGLHDIENAWSYDPEAFIALRFKNELIGGGSIISYQGEAGFMGLFILRKDFRNQGLGTVLWHERLRRLQSRLNPGAPISMDGVYSMASFYEKGGFKFLYRDLRSEGTAQGILAKNAVPLSDIPFAKIDEFDQYFFKAPRTEFLKKWLCQTGGHGIALMEGGVISAYGFARPCRDGFKIGPAFAKNPTAGEELISSLMSKIPGEKVQIDFTEINLAAKAFMQKINFTESFGCARLVYGQDPQIPTEGIFGLTSFEFG